MKQILILILSSTISVTMNAQTLQGNHWTAKKVEGAYTISIEDRASILDALTGFITSQNIQAGQVTGIGATNEATLRFFDPSSKKYVDKTFNEQMEIAPTLTMYRQTNQEFATRYMWKGTSTVTGHSLDCGHFLQEERPEETLE